MDEIVSNFIKDKLYGITMQFKGVNSTLHYKCDYSKPTSSDVQIMNRRRSSPITLPKMYSNIESFLQNIDIVSLETTENRSTIDLKTQQEVNDIFRYKNSIVLTALFPIYNVDAKLNAFVESVLNKFNISIKNLIKTATKETQYISKQTKSVSMLIKVMVGGEEYDLITNAPDIQYKKITILNTTYINVTIGFSFYTEFTCIPKILFKILYKYAYELISIRHNSIDYISQIKADYIAHVKNKLNNISDEIIFSPPTKCLKLGGIEYRRARQLYYANKNQEPPTVILSPTPPLVFTSNKEKKQFKKHGLFFLFKK